MDTSVKLSSRNQSMDYFKFVASLAVVLIHIPFPGSVGALFTAIGSIAVPIFFAITGYFNYSASRASVARRLRSIVKLYLFAFAATAALGAASTGLTGGNVFQYLKDFCLFGREELFQILLLHYDPRNVQLWYLIALIFCYLVLLLYLGFQGDGPVNYHPLYALGCMQFLLFVAFGMLAQPARWEPPEVLYRSGYFYGGAFFTFGIFLREYQERILGNFRLTPRKLTALLAAGLVLCCLQASSIGGGRLSLGGALEVAALMLLMIRCPQVPKALRGCASCLGRLSVYIYIFHMALIRFYTSVLKAPLTARLGLTADLESWLAPLIVILLSLLCAILCDLAQQRSRRPHPVK